MKYSKSALGLLTAQYRSVLKKCWLINVGLFALGAVTTANTANAADVNVNVIASLSDYTTGITAGTTVIGTVNLGAYSTTTEMESYVTGLNYQNATQVGTLITNNAAGATYNNTTSGLTANTIQKAIDEVAGNINSKSLTVNTSTGVATITDGTVTADVYTKTQSDSIFVNKDASNVFSNSNTFTGAVTATSGLTVSGGILTATTSSLGTASVTSLTSSGNISGTTGNFSSTLTADSLSVTNGATVGGNLGVTGNQTVGGTLTTTGMTYANGGLTTNNLVLSSNYLTGADTGASAITSGSANTVATTATVLKSAEYADYTGTKVTGSSAATLKGALDATNTQVNTNTTNITNITDGTTYTTAMQNNVKGTINNAAGTGLTATAGVLSVNTATSVADGNTSYVTSDLLYDQDYQTATNVSDAISASTTGTGAVKTYVEGLGYQTASDVTSSINNAAGTGLTASGGVLSVNTATSVTNGDTNYVTSDLLYDQGYQNATQVGTAIATAVSNDVSNHKVTLSGDGGTTTQEVYDTTGTANYVTENAAGATYSNTSSGLAATTIQDAIDALDTNVDANTANIGTLSSLTTTANTNLVAAINEVDANADAAQTEIDNAETALGVLTATGTYDNTALSSNFYKSLGTPATTLAGSLNNLALNLANATGSSITDTGAVNNNYTISGIAYGTPAATTSLAQAIGQLNNNIGSAITGTTRAATSMSTVAGNSVNANIQALDTAIGGNATGTYVSSSASVNANISTLDSTIGSMAGFASNHYATNTSSVAANLSALDGQVYNNTTKNGTQDTGIGNVASALGVTYNASTGAVGSTDYSSNNYVTDGTSAVVAIGALDTKLKAVETNQVKLDADNEFTGENTFKNTNGIHIQNTGGGNDTQLTATDNGLTVNRAVEATGFKIFGSSNSVTSIDTTGAAVTDAAANANVMATGATVYNGAENAKFTGTLVKTDTTATPTIASTLTATNAALNNVLTTAGTEVDSAKVDVQWNGADNTLAGVLGTGVYTSTNNVASGDSVTTAISSLDKTIGGAITSTGVLNGVTLGSATGETSVATALGTVSDTIGKTTAAFADGTALAGATIGQGAASDVSVVNALGTLNTALKTTNDTIGAGTLGDGTAGTIAGVAGDLNGKTIGASYSVTQAIADLNATNQNQNGSMSTLAGLINGQTVGADGNLAGTATTLATGFTANNLTAAANELLGDITVTTAGNYITTGANVANNLSLLDTQVKANADAISGQDAKITSLGNNIGGNWTGNTFAHDNYNANQYNILNTDNLTTAIGKLDTVVGDVDAITVTGNTGSTVVAAINRLNSNFTNGTIDAVFDDTTVTSLKVGSAFAISGTSTGQLDMNGNTMTNLAGATFVNGTANANLNADASGNLVTDSKFIAQSLDIGTTGKGFDASGNAKTGTLQIGDANAITGTSTSLNMNGNDLTNIKDLSATGNATIGGNAVVTGTLTAGATTISADSTVSGTPASALAVTATNSVDGTSTSFSVTSDGVGIVGDTVMKGDLTITDGTNGFTLSSDTVSIHMLDGTTDTAHPVLNVSDDTFVNGMVASTDGLGVFKYDTTAGRYEEVFDVDNTGSIKSDMLTTNNTTNTIALGKDTSTVTTMNGSLKFNAGSESVNAIDDGTTAQTTGGANTMATVATVLKSAENAVFTPSGATGSNITGTQTINTAIDTLDTKMGDVSSLAVNGSTAADLTTAINDLDTNMDNVLGGIYSATTGGYDNTQLAADGFTTQANLTASLKNYAANVEAATGGTFSGATWSGNVVTTTAVDYSYGTSAADIMKAVSQVASNVGDSTGLDSIAARTAIAGNNGVASTQTVNANINALNATIGGLSGLNTALGNLTNGGTTTPATVVTALNNIDATLGTIHGLSTKLGAAGLYGNLAVGTTVEDHLTQINASIGNRVAGFSTAKAVDYADSALNGQDIVTAISQVASNVGTAADLAYTANGVASANTVNANISNINSVIGDVSQLSTTHYVADTTNLTDAVRVLDHNMERIDDDLKDLHHQHRTGMASMAAMSALVPNARSNGNTSISLGTGAYQGHTAVALGGFHYLTDNLLLNAGAAWGNTDDVVYRVGLTYSF